MKKTVIVVTHGDKYSCPNPGMTPEGFAQVAALRNLLPLSPPAVVCGTGKRHLDVAKALALTPTRYTAAVGGPDSLEIIAGKKFVLLADGTLVPHDGTYTTLADETQAIRQVIADLPDNAIVCAGRPSMIMLGNKEAKSAAVHAVYVEDGQITGFRVLTELGQAEAGTV